MSTPIVYRSSDASAPTLSGTKGDLVNLLDKILVAGYGSKAAAGWTKPYTGTNVAVFKQGGGSSYYMRVDDNGTSDATNGVRDAVVRGWEVKADANDTVDANNTGPFPTAAQITLGTFWRKSSLGSNATPDSTARVWKAIADDRTVYLFVQTGDVAGTYVGYMFGDIYSFKPTTDTSKCMIIGNEVFGSGATANRLLQMRYNGTFANVQAGHFLSRSYTQVGGSITSGKFGDGGKSPAARGALIGHVGNIAGPNIADGGIYLSPIYVYETTSGNIRGQLRGLWHNCHTLASFNEEDTFDANVGKYSGRSFLVWKPGPSYGDGSGGLFPGFATVETTDWYTNS